MSFNDCKNIRNQINVATCSNLLLFFKVFKAGSAFFELSAQIVKTWGFLAALKKDNVVYILQKCLCYYNTFSSSGPK